MRLTSLIVLLAVVGGAAFVLVFKRDWLFSKAKEGIQLAQGYTPAKSPREAMEQFQKAVKERNYDAAAKYCGKDYAEKLKKAHAAASELGNIIDGINSVVEEKGFKDDKVTILLTNLDPFPLNFKIGDVKEVKDKDQAFGVFVLDVNPNLKVIPPQELQRLDLKMFNTCLAVPVIGSKLEIKAVKEGDSKSWVIEVPMVQVHHDLITYYLDHYKSYVNGLKEFRDRIRQGRYLKDAIPGELTGILVSSK